MSARLVTRRRLAELNAQDWADFRKHWPMRVFSFFADIVGGFIFGLALALSVFVWALQKGAA